MVFLKFLNLSNVLLQRQTPDQYRTEAFLLLLAVIIFISTFIFFWRAYENHKKIKKMDKSNETKNSDDLLKQLKKEKDDEIERIHDEIERIQKSNRLKIQQLTEQFNNDKKNEIEKLENKHQKDIEDATQLINDLKKKNQDNSSKSINAENISEEDLQTLRNKIYKDADNYYQESLKSTYATSYYNLGIACYYKGNYIDAIKSYEKAIQLKSDFDQAFDSMGLAHQKTGNQTKANECFQKAKEIRAKK